MRGSIPLADGRCVRGASHVRKGKPCEDALHFGRRDNALALAVSDGHSSASRATEGAWIAVHTAVEWLLRFAWALPADQRSNLNLVEELGRKQAEYIIREWSARVLAEAREPMETQRDRATLLREFGATLLAVLATPEFLFFLQIGDGDILSIDYEGRATRPLTKDERNFADATLSLCSPNVWLSTKVVVQRPPEHEALITLSTDGCSNSFQTEADFLKMGSDYLQLVRQHGLTAVAEELPRILDRVTTLGSGDDVSLGLLYFRPSSTAHAKAELAAETSFSKPTTQALSGPTQAPTEVDIPLQATCPLSMGKAETPSPDLQSTLSTAPSAAAQEDHS